jgi:hypothetical protein
MLAGTHLARDLRNPASPVIRRLLCFFCCLLAALPGLAAVAQQAPAAQPNGLVTGKLIYVAPMPNDLDLWIIASLRRWGKYKITGNPEGVDLVIEAEKANSELKLETRAGVAQPKGADRPHLPSSKSKTDNGLPGTIDVTNWVSGESVWHSDILDRKPKKSETSLPPGPKTKIFAHDSTAEQLAETIVAKLKEYEEGLEKSTGGKP